MGHQKGVELDHPEGFKENFGYGRCDCLVFGIVLDSGRLDPQQVVSVVHLTRTPRSLLVLDDDDGIGLVVQPDVHLVLTTEIFQGVRVPTKQKGQLLV